ncbi:MAG: hypothetical protein ACEPO8_00425 [Rhodothermaceae bacterium]
MDRKIINTIILIVVLVLLSVTGGGYSFWFLQKEIDKQNVKIKKLEETSYDTEKLMDQLQQLKDQAAELDSILALRKFNIPIGLKQSGFYNFINKVSFSFAPQSYVNIEYESENFGEHFNYYQYKLSGQAYFNDLYKLVYAVEQSKELKKIENAEIDNFVKVDDDGIPYYLVNFSMNAKVYFANDDRFASAEFRENRLKPNPIYDLFYPLIRNEIPPNINNLLDVQTAKLLALVPDGAFLADESGNTFLLWEGD